KVGRPPSLEKPRKPRFETQEETQNNPPLEIEREIEIKDKIESKKESELDSHAHFEKPIIPFQSFGKQPIKKLRESCANHSEWLNTISKKNQLLPNQTLEWLDAFELHLLGSGKTEETEQEFKRY